MSEKRSFDSEFAIDAFLLFLLETGSPAYLRFYYRQEKRNSLRPVSVSQKGFSGLSFYKNQWRE